MAQELQVEKELTPAIKIKYPGMISKSLVPEGARGNQSSFFEAIAAQVGSALDSGQLEALQDALWNLHQALTKDRGEIVDNRELIKLPEGKTDIADVNAEIAEAWDKAYRVVVSCAEDIDRRLKIEPTLSERLFQKKRVEQNNSSLYSALEAILPQAYTLNGNKNFPNELTRLVLDGKTFAGSAESIIRDHITIEGILQGEAFGSGAINQVRKIILSSEKKEEGISPDKRRQEAVVKEGTFQQTLRQAFQDPVLRYIRGKSQEFGPLRQEMTLGNMPKIKIDYISDYVDRRMNHEDYVGFNLRD